MGQDRVAAVRIVRNKLVDSGGTPRPQATDEEWDLPAELVFKAVGYRGVKIPGVPFHEAWGVIPNDEGRVDSNHVHNIGKSARTFEH